MTTPNKLFWVRDQESAVAVLASTKEAALAAGARELDYNESEESAADQGLEALDENDMREEPVGFLAFWHEFVQREVAKARVEGAADAQEACAARIDAMATAFVERAADCQDVSSNRIYQENARLLRDARDAIRSTRTIGNDGGVVDERAACAAEVEAIADQVQKEIDTTFPTGEALSELVAARTVLAKATAAIRARSNTTT